MIIRHCYITALSFYYYISIASGQCPTMGMTSYILVSITSDISEIMFKDAVDYYGKIHNLCGEGTHIEIYFGYLRLRTVTSDDFDSLWEQNDVTDLYTSSLVEELNSTVKDKLYDRLEYFIQSVSVLYYIVNLKR